MFNEQTDLHQKMAKLDPRDTNGDGVVSPQEAAAYVHQYMQNASPEERDQILSEYVKNMPAEQRLDVAAGALLGEPRLHHRRMKLARHHRVLPVLEVDVRQRDDVILLIDTLLAQLEAGMFGE